MFKVTLKNNSGQTRTINVHGETQIEALQSKEFMKQYISGEKIVSCVEVSHLRTFRVIIQNCNCDDYTSMIVHAASRKEAIENVENEVCWFNTKVVEVHEILKSGGKQNGTKQKKRNKH